MIRRHAATALLLSLVAASAGAQDVAIRDAGPRGVRRIVGLIEAAIAKPHLLLPPDSSPVRFARGTVQPQTVIVLGRDVAVAGRVDGDVVVIGGNLFIQPGARISGRGLAVGGGAYPSMLGEVRGGIEGHLDFTWDAVREGDRYALSYRALRTPPSPMFSLPLVYGVRVPTYERSDGLSLPFGPLFAFDSARWEIEPIVTYRSQLGAMDPSLRVRFLAEQNVVEELRLERSTYTNDAWIWSDLVNSAAFFAWGSDSRNYFRADRAELRGTATRPGTYGDLEVISIARYEQSSAVRPGLAPTSAPWTITGRKDADGSIRPNPQVPDAEILSALMILRGNWDITGVKLGGYVQGEWSPQAKYRFAQFTANITVLLPTFGTQRFTSLIHAVTSSGTGALPQRWSYVGGSATLPFLHMAEQGGDEVMYVESQYDIPFEAINVPLLGAPSIGLRHVLGGAAVGRFPTLEQNIGLRLQMGFVRVDYLVDPTRKRGLFTAGLSLR